MDARRGLWADNDPVPRGNGGGLGATLLGTGVPGNGAEAVEWLQLAIERRQIGAASVLGMVYANGKDGVKPNYKLARELLARATAEGDRHAGERLDMMYK